MEQGDIRIVLFDLECLEEVVHGLPGVLHPDMIGGDDMLSGFIVFRGQIFQDPIICT